jgi:hypothetical protein
VLARAVAVLEGKAPALTDKALPGGSGSRGVFFFAALGNKILDDIKSSADSKLLKTDITSLALEIGEVGADMRAIATAVMASADGAQKVKSVVDGIVAMVALSDSVKLPQPIDHYVKTKVAGTTVEVTVSVPEAELVKLIDEARSSHP